jgi:hypothetical protein
VPGTIFALLRFRATIKHHFFKWGDSMQRVKFIDKMAQGKLQRREMLALAAAFGVGRSVLPTLRRPCVGR